MAGEQHLHPWSWLFAAMQHLKQALLPLLVFMFARRGEGITLWLMAAVAVPVVGLSLWQYFTYRYRLLPDHIEIRSGLLARQLRQVAYARIHNVALHQSLLHRLFGVAEVRLESAAGATPEAHMRVLHLHKALALEQLVRAHGKAGEVATPAAQGTARHTQPATPPLLALSSGEIIRHGLVSNRGMVVVAAGFATLGQFADELGRHFSSELERSANTALHGLAAFHATLGWPDYALLSLAALLMLWLLLGLFSVALSLLQYHGFVLGETGRRLTVSRGLLSKLRSSMPKRRIQAWHMQESWLHRRFKRRALRVQSAAGMAGQPQERGIDALAPIAPVATCDALINHLLPGAHWPPVQWQRLHRLAWLRLWLGTWLWLLPLTAFAVWLAGHWGLWLLLWLLPSALLAWQSARHAGWSLHGRLIAVRHGWWSKHWRFAEVEKLQSLRLSASPLDKLFGMRGLLLDTAGAKPLAPLRIDCLPPEAARQLFDTLARQLARSPLRW